MGKWVAWGNDGLKKFASGDFIWYVGKNWYEDPSPVYAKLFEGSQVLLEHKSPPFDNLEDAQRWADAHQLPPPHEDEPSKRKTAWDRVLKA
jgi:hypothetical protein